MKNYPHQTKVADSILDGKNVILQAPTGAGKTRAAMLPFLEAWHDKSDVHNTMPLRCIYSVPMRVLATQFSDEYEKIVRKYTTTQALEPMNVTIQTGSLQKDRELAGNLIFATIDQTLSSFLLSPYSLSGRKANLNAGAVASSYLVFDEFHLFDPDSTLPTTLQMLKMLKGITPFILMTATFSSTMLTTLAEELDAVVVGQSKEERVEFANLPSQKNKQRFYHTVDASISADAVLEKHQERGSLVICNQVERARKLFEEIQAQTGDTEVLLLHSRLLADDRKQTEGRIRTVFGKDAEDSDTIVISTQSIEVGVDMSSSVLHTELAPANAIIQRAGRCARYEGETGSIYIYKRALNKEGEEINLCENVMPYKGQAEVINKTWDAFNARNGQQFTYDSEQDVLSEAHEAQDELTIQHLKENRRNHKEGIFAVMRGDSSEDARNYIRQIVSQQITIHDDPNEVAKNPFDYPSFGLHPGTVQGYLENWLNSPEYLYGNDIVAIRLNEDEDRAQSNDERYYPAPINQKKSAWMTPLLVIHPRLASYNPVLGFLANQGGEWMASPPPKKDKSASQNRFSYRLETYEKHIELVYQAFIEFWHEAEWAATKLEEHFEWEKGSVTKAAQLAVLLHDVGKLSKGWQGWVRKYQAAIGEPVQKGEVYAHTELQTHEHREIAKQMKRRPWHAVEGALAVAPIIAQTIGIKPLAQAAMSAIARHHAAHSDSYHEFQLEADSHQHITNTFLSDMELDLNRLWGLEKPVPLGHKTEQAIAEPSDKAAFLAYLLIVRVLRRADSKGTERGSLPQI